MDIESGRVRVDTQNFSEFNKPALIRFYNIEFINPQIRKDGQLCQEPECTILSYDKDTHTLTVRVQGFTEYIIEEEPSLLKESTIVKIVIISFLLLGTLLGVIFSRKRYSQTKSLKS